MLPVNTDKNTDNKLIRPVCKTIYTFVCEPRI